MAYDVLLLHMMCAQVRSLTCASFRDLQALHEQLVAGGIISEAEFWRHRQHLLRQHAQDGAQGRQKPGLSNAMIEQSMDPNSNKAGSASQHLHSLCSMLLVSSML